MINWFLLGMVVALVTTILEFCVWFVITGKHFAICVRCNRSKILGYAPMVNICRPCQKGNSDYP